MNREHLILRYEEDKSLLCDGSIKPSMELPRRSSLLQHTDRQMASTKEVLDHHLKCFAEGDLEGILFDYAPGAVLFTPDGPLKGAEAIRSLFQAMVAEFGKPAATVEFGKPGATFNLEQQFIEGEFAYILWSAETVDNVYEMGMDTFVVRDGKIVAQSFTGKVTPKD